jgi:chromosome segregation ATPase
MIIEPIIPQTQIQVQTPELPKHEFIDRRVNRRASMTDTQPNAQQRQMEDIIKNYDQMVSEIVNNYDNQIYHIIWYNTNTVETMNLYVNDLENRLNNLNNKEEKFDELINVQTKRINEMEQIVEKLTQLNKERESVIKNQQQNIDILEKSMENYRIEQVYYEQWKESMDKKENDNNFTIKGLQIKIDDYEERLTNYSKMIKEIQELKERINRQNYYITNLENDEEKLKKEKLILKNNLEKSIQELQEIKNNQPIMEISQEPNKEIPIMESDEGSQSDEPQTNEEIPMINPKMDEKLFKGKIPIMEVYNKDSNKKSKKRKAMEIIPRIVKKLVKKK